jgi:alkylation response protein AidB-like acyl-CoA dehydrogenase
MDLTFNERELAFRDELRAWFDAYDPGPEPEGDEDAHYAWRRAFQRDLANGGWAAVHWPVEYGGRGATLTESAIFYEELARSGSPLPANVLGLLLAGPTIMTWGTPEQKERYLTPIMTAEEIWCQGFSEPDAGSDLASLKTRAVKLDDSRGVHSGEAGDRADAKREGDDWVVSGQKVWTSGAQYSRWCMLVARTDPDVPKHKGLTYFLMDMQQDAVQVRPLRQITGEREFNELFIDGARIPDENVLGGVGNGWKVALTTLMNERAGLAFFLQVRLRQTLDRLIEEAAGRGLLDDPIAADRLGELHLRAEVLRLTAYRGLTAIEKYGQPGPEGSLVKWMWSDTNQQLTQFAADLLGPSTLQAGGRWAYELLRARGNSIEGGTTEVLKNIVAERVLGLPRAR